MLGREPFMPGLQRNLKARSRARPENTGDALLFLVAPEEFDYAARAEKVTLCD